MTIMIVVGTGNRRLVVVRLPCELLCRTRIKLSLMIDVITELKRPFPGNGK